MKNEWVIDLWLCSIVKAKAVPLHTTKALGGRGGIAPTRLCRSSNLDRPVVQSVVRHYTDWATPAPTIGYMNNNNNGNMKNSMSKNNTMNNNREKWHLGVLLRNADRQEWSLKVVGSICSRQTVRNTKIATLFSCTILQSFYTSSSLVGISPLYFSPSL
jgi:hypothetical protein